MSEPHVTIVEVQPDTWCALCGADDETGIEVVSGFLDVVVITPGSGGQGGAVAARRICNACLSNVLAVVFRLGGQAEVARLVDVSIAAQRAGDDPEG